MEKYPIGKQDFKVIREGGYVYVDKTGFIPKLVNDSNYYFFSRPRRFGKSLFLSTLEYFFQGQKELFAGLEVVSTDWGWDWTEYPVIHLDLNGADYTQPLGLESRLSSNLHYYEKKYATESNEDLSLPERFRVLIENIYSSTGKKIVVLVDEYEKPILDSIDYPDLFRRNKDLLHGFYGVIKSLDKYLQFVFLTGVTKFGQMNIFSGLNNIRDISLNPEYGSLCGVEEKDLMRYFPVGIRKLGEKLRLTPEKVLDLLKENYDGYHFCENCADLYNPYSLLNAFADSKIKPYWAYTATPTILAKVLHSNDFDLPRLEGIRVSEQRLMGLNNNFDDPAVLFYHTGYLTIKDYDPQTDLFILGYPNKEVEQAFFEFLLPNFSGKNRTQTSSFLDEFKIALDDGDPYKAMELLTRFSSSISYDMIPSPEVERHFQYIIYIIVKLLASSASFVKVEEKTSNGRIDLLVINLRYVYIFEFKRDASGHDALKQIYDKEYALQFQNDNRKVFLIGANFSTSKKRLEDYVIEG